jgi:hypothetical protein
MAHGLYLGRGTLRTWAVNRIRVRVPIIVSIPNEGPIIRLRPQQPRRDEYETIELVAAEEESTLQQQQQDETPTKKEVIQICSVVRKIIIAIFLFMSSN